MGKRIQRVEIDKMNTKLLELGYVGENEHTEVQIDCSGVLWDYPEATAEMTVQAPNGEKYPVVPELSDNVVVWDVTDSDLVYAGSGKIQITLKNGTEVIKSASCGTRIMESIMPTGDAPTPLENWMDRAEETAHQIALTAKDEVIEQIQDAAEEARESIPADYTQLSDDVTGLKSAFEQLDANVITESAGPAPIVSVADGADGMPMRSVEVAIEPVQDLHGYDAPWPSGGGKNKLHVTLTTQTVNGVTFTVNEDGTIKANGTATSNIFLEIGTFNFETGQNLVLNGCPSGGSGFNLYAALSTGNRVDAGTGIEINPTVTENASIRISVYNGTSVSNILYKPMIRLATEADATFIPYSNICPISGFDSVKVMRTGKNLLAKPFAHVDTAPNSIDECFFLKAGMYTLSVDSFTGATSWRFGIRLKDASGNDLSDEKYNPILSIMYWNTPSSMWIIGGNTGNKTLQFTLVEDCYIRILFALGDTAASTVANGAMLSIGSTALPYEPYQGQTYEVTFPSEAGTVYGGTLDVASGKIVVDMAKVDLKQVDFVTMDRPANVGGGKCFIGNIATPLAVYPTNESRQKYSSGQIGDAYYASGNRCNAYQTQNRTYFRCGFADPNYPATIEEFNTWKQQQSAFEIAYVLASPIEYTLTPQEIKTLLGTNNSWSDAGNTAITYPADTKLYIDRKITEAVANALNA